MRIVRALVVWAVLTATLTGFFYVHEGLPVWLRAPTSLLLTPVALASGLSAVFAYGDVYRTPWMVALANGVGVACAIGLAHRLWRGWKPTASNEP